MEKAGNSYSRRDFLKTAGMMGAVFAVTKIEWTENEDLQKRVNGVEVFGLDVPIQNKEQMVVLMDGLDKKFLNENDPFRLKTFALNEDQTKERLLPPKTRYLTAIVEKSVYQSFLENQQATGMDYVTWITANKDYFNRMMKSGLIEANIEISLRRVVVVADGYGNTQLDRHPLDTDFIWSDNRDYRLENMKEKSANYFWYFEEQNDGSIRFQNNSYTQGNYEDQVIVPTTKLDSLNTLKRGWIDAGLCHEWSHLAGSVFDPYTMNYDSIGGMQMDFRYNTWYFQKPDLDPSMAMVINENEKRRIRSYFSDSKGLGRAGEQEGLYYLGLLPKKVQFEMTNCESFELMEMRYQNPVGSIWDYYKINEKYFAPNLAKQKIAGQLEINNPEEVFGRKQMGVGGVDAKHYPMTYLIKTKIGGFETQLYFPRILLNMACMGGETETAKFKIEMTPIGTGMMGPRDLQMMEFVRNEDVQKYIDNKIKHMRIPVAKMALPGTGLTCIWSFTEKV